jgi:hypothetical protein
MVVMIQCLVIMNRGHHHLSQEHRFHDFLRLHHRLPELQEEHHFLVFLQLLDYQ